MKKIECWKLESRGEDRNDFVAYFDSGEEADKAAPHCGGYPPGAVSQVTITIYDTAAEWKPETDLEARKSGLAKLNSRERLALGLPAEKF